MAKKSKAKAAVVKGILTKMELEFSSKISETRARAKLERHIDKNGWDEDIVLDDAEIKYMEELGYNIDEDDPVSASDDEDDEDDVEEEDDEDDFEEEEEDEDEEDEDEEDEEDEDEEDEDEEDEPAPKKSASKKSEKKTKKDPAPKSKKKMGKFTAICQVLHKKKNHTIDEIAEKADELYVKNGGESNLGGTLKFTKTTLKVLEEFGSLSVTKDKVKML